jgi:hypothetical protein
MTKPVKHATSQRVSTQDWLDEALHLGRQSNVADEGFSDRVMARLPTRRKVPMRIDWRTAGQRFNRFSLAGAGLGCAAAAAINNLTEHGAALSKLVGATAPPLGALPIAYSFTLSLIVAAAFVWYMLDDD